MRWSVVTPLVNYLKLMINRPKKIPENTEPAIKKFLEGMQQDMLKWLDEIEVPEQFDGMDNEAIVEELAVLLNYIVKEKRWVYLQRLVDKGALPLKMKSKIEAQQVRLRLQQGNCTAEEIELIVDAEIHLTGSA